MGFYREDYINEPVTLIIHLKNTTTGGQKQEVQEEVSIDVQTRPVPRDVGTLHGNDEQKDVITNMKNIHQRMCAPCQLWKQTKSSHTKFQLTSMTRVLELLHMDLMGHIHLGNIVGKRYIYVEVINMACYMLNWAHLWRGTLMNPYEI